MSFSSEARLEIARILPTNRCCALAELAAVLRMEGFRPASSGEGGDQSGFDGGFEVALGHPAVARKVYLLFKGIGVDAALNVDRRQRHGSRRGYRVRVVRGAKKTLEEIASCVGGNLDGETPPSSRCCQKAYLRGAFLCRGSLTAPAKTYHLEIAVDRERAAASILRCLKGLDLQGRISRRKGSFVVYFKESEEIVEVLSLIGAHNALLELENVRIVKGMRNRVNRLVNSETANLDKTVKAAVAQLDAIGTIEATRGLRWLPKPLRALAEHRLRHPYASLRELGEMSQPRISKSGVSYRMKQILALAREIEGEETFAGKKERSVRE